MPLVGVCDSLAAAAVATVRKRDAVLERLALTAGQALTSPEEDYTSEMFSPWNGT